MLRGITLLMWCHGGYITYLTITIIAHLCLYVSFFLLDWWVNLNETLQEHVQEDSVNFIMSLQMFSVYVCFRCHVQQV